MIESALKLLANSISSTLVTRRSSRHAGAASRSWQVLSNSEQWRCIQYWAIDLMRNWWKERWKRIVLVVLASYTTTLLVDDDYY